MPHHLSVNDKRYGVHEYYATDPNNSYYAANPNPAWQTPPAANVAWYGAGVEYATQSHQPPDCRGAIRYCGFTGITKWQSLPHPGISQCSTRRPGSSRSCR